MVKTVGEWVVRMVQRAVFPNELQLYLLPRRAKSLACPTSMGVIKEWAS